MFGEDVAVGEKFVASARGTAEKDQGPELRKIDERLLSVLESLKIDSDPEIIRRLMLLDTRRRSLGKTVSASNGTSKDGRIIEKHVGSHLEHTLNLVNICETC